MALCPAAQRHRRIWSGWSVPVRTAGSQSACSTQVYAASKTSGAARRQWRILLKNHSEE